jgi:hypothetical protein
MWGSRKSNQLGKGTVADRPWAVTLATVSASTDRCQLTIKTDGKLYQVAFVNGAIVGAVSPSPADTVQRIALTNRLVPPANVAAAVRIMGRNDDVEKFSDAALAGDAGAVFKRRVVIQRVARTFSIERGDYVVEDKITIPMLRGVEVDVRAPIYQGLRLHVSEVQLAADLKKIGSRFMLYPEAAPFLAKFELEEEGAPIIDALRGSTSIAEIEALHRELDPRLVHATMAALALCNVITPIEPRMDNDQTAPVHNLARGTRRAIDNTTGGFETVPTTALPSPLTQSQIRQLISQRFAMLEVGTDLFSFLGIPFGAPAKQVREAYLELARYVRPERLTERGIRDERDEARAVFAQASIALTTLTDEQRRREYMSSFRRRSN